MFCFEDLLEYVLGVPGITRSIPEGAYYILSPHTNHLYHLLLPTFIFNTVAAASVTVSSVTNSKPRRNKDNSPSVQMHTRRTSLVIDQLPVKTYASFVINVLSLQICIGHAIHVQLIQVILLKIVTMSKGTLTIWPPYCTNEVDLSHRGILYLIQSRI